MPEQLKPVTTDAAPPPTDDRLRHFTRRVSPEGVLPARYSRTALCGAEVRELLIDHGPDVCQECVDQMRREQS